MDRDGFAAWLDRYVSAWRTYDPVAIGDLFSVDATYRYHPEDEPIMGRAAIVADWLTLARRARRRGAATMSRSRSRAIAP